MKISNLDKTYTKFDQNNGQVQTYSTIRDNNLEMYEWLRLLISNETQEMIMDRIENQNKSRKRK